MPSFPKKFKHPRPNQENRKWKQGSRQERGYDRQWEKLRNWYIEQHPLCENCIQIEKVVSSEHVDHIVEFRGLDDPLRLDPNNLRALCLTCHMAKTARSRFK